MNHDNLVLRNTKEDVEGFINNVLYVIEFLGKEEDNLINKDYKQTLHEDHYCLADHIAGLNVLVNALLNRLGGSVRLSLQELKNAFPHRIHCSSNNGLSLDLKFSEPNEEVIAILSEWEILSED